MILALREREWVRRAFNIIYIRSQKLKNTIPFKNGIKKMKYLIIILIIGMLLLPGCDADDPITVDVHFTDLYGGNAYFDTLTLGGVSFAVDDIPAGGGVGDPFGDIYTQNIYPTADDTYNVGSAASGYHNIYATDGIFDYLYVGYNLNTTGNITANSVAADIEGYSVDLVHDYESGISENDTLSLVFGFEPSKISISYSAICHHVDYPYEVGHTTGHSLITVTGVDTISITTNYTAVTDDNGVMNSAILHSHTDVLMAAGGYDGYTFARCWGTGAWDTATHTLVVTFDDVQNAYDPWNFFEVMATAYR